MGFVGLPNKVLCMLSAEQERSRGAITSLYSRNPIKDGSRQPIDNKLDRLFPV